jgi:hypothetical protein
MALASGSGVNLMAALDALHGLLCRGNDTSAHIITECYNILLTCASETSDMSRELDIW